MSGLPQNLDAERYVLASVMREDGLYAQVAAVLTAEDFLLDKHQRIFRAMAPIRDRGELIDRITVYEQLTNRGEAESCGGFSYLVDLDTGMPDNPHVESYARSVKEKSDLRKIITISQHSINQALQPGESPERIAESSAKLLRECCVPPDESAETIAEIIAEEGGVDAFFAGTKGLSSPWSNVDYYTGGWKPGELSVVAARPSMGKTAFGVNAAWHAAKRNVPVNFYTLEMDKRAITLRFISLLTGITFNDLDQGQLTKVERGLVSEALTAIQDTPLRIIRATKKSVMAIRSHLERSKLKRDTRFSVVDYLGRFIQAGSDRNRAHELGAICSELKAMAIDTGTAMLLLCQLNRQLEGRPDKHPSLSDLRDSGEIEEHADIVAFIHRPEYFNRDDASLKFKAEFIIGKNRNGQTRTLDLHYQEHCGKFSAETLMEQP